MDQNLIFITIFGMTLVTYLPRLLPIWLLSGRSLPHIITSWLRYVPPAVLAAMLLPAILVENNQIHFTTSNLYLLALFPTLWVTWKTKSLFAAVITGMALVALGRLLTP